MGDYLLWRWVFVIYPCVSSYTSLMKTWQGCLGVWRQKMKVLRRNIPQPWFCARGQRLKQLSSRSQTAGQICRSGPVAWIMASRHWLSFSLKILHMDLEGTGYPRVFGEFLLQHLDVKFPKSISKLLGLGFQYTSLRIRVRVWVKVFLHH